MTARRAEPNGGPRVVTMGKYRSWAPRDTARWSLRVITMAPRSQPETGSNQTVRVAGTSTEMFQNQENISHLKQETRKCTESPASVGCRPLAPAPFHSHISIRGRSLNTEPMASDTLVEFRLQTFLL